MTTNANDQNHDDADDQSDGANNQDNDGDDEETITVTKKELEGLRRAKSKANKEAMERRRMLEDLGIDPKTGRPVDSGDDDDEDDDEPAARKKPTTKKNGSNTRDARNRVRAQVELEYKPKLHKLATRIALDDAKVLPNYRGLIMNAIDFAEVDVDDEGNVVGLEDQLDELKTRYPDCFAKGRKSTSNGNGQGNGVGASALGGTNKTVNGGTGAQKSYLEMMEAQYQRGGAR